MEREELINYARANAGGIMAVITEQACASNDRLRWNVQLLHCVYGDDYVYSGMGRYFSDFFEAYKFARECDVNSVEVNAKGMSKRTAETIMRFYGKGTKFLDELPEGWRYREGASTAPNGWQWAGHGSLFRRKDGLEKYESALIRQC